MDNTVGRLQSLFSQHQLDVIIGSLLGDARLECRSIGKRNPITARLRVHHGEKQKEYVFWKYKILKNFVGEEPREISWNNPKRKLQETSWYFHTKSIEEFGALYRYFYKDSVKILPDDIFSFLTPRMITVWFMDDGSNTRESFTLNTHGFSTKEQKRIVEFFRVQYAINPTLVKDRTKFKLAIGRREYQKFLRLIEPFIIPSMIYKIRNPRNDLSASNMRADGVSMLTP
ncbi:hypothetical protein HY967_01450 [Candidatus Jorgensenbacteria bacterium]|nr:hypothetical protein [Candidatus Jorgensenbacteria bacterium]